jgi:hypothetical protein
LGSQDGVEHAATDWKSKIESKWSLVMETLKRTDSGVYTCRAGNKLGTASVNFTLDVYGKETRNLSEL